MTDIATFIATYTAAGESKIRFDWNGKHADGFVDSNMDFRRLVREAVLADVSLAPIELIRDLFRAETQCSKEAWGIVKGVNVLAERLLRHGGVQYLDDYLEGKFKSFDANLGSAFEYDSGLAQAMLSAVRERLAAEPSSHRSQMWRAGEKLFQDWLAEPKPRL